MNQEQIKALETTINDGYSNITGMVVQVNGTKLYENYFHGYTVDDDTHVYSVTKSVFSALIGIAIDQGYIKNTDQNVLDFFPDYVVKEGEKTIQNLTLKHLITMTAPYKCQVEPYEEFFGSSNWVKFALDLLGGEYTGEFRYSPIVGSHILGGILANAVGQSVLDFAKENLFLPLGIQVPGNVVLATKEEHIAVMNNRNTKGWVADPQGINTASWGLFLKPVDMAKIGQLYINGGTWDGRRLISAEWIKESTKEHSRWDELPYGYLWWVVDEQEHSYAAMGDGGNVIYINEEKQLVVSITSFMAPEVKDRIDFIKGYIEPLFVPQRFPSPIAPV